jgi:hypothetical protein
MQELQEQIPVIYMDVVYAGIAGANSCRHILYLSHQYQIKVNAIRIICKLGNTPPVCLGK